MKPIRMNLVVFVALALAASFASFKSRTYSPGERCQSEMHKANLALEAYASDNMGKYPVSFQAAEKYCPYPLHCLDSPSGRYLYEVSKDRLGYTITCTGIHGRSQQFPCIVNERGVYPPTRPGL
jgi:hypothetical protein